jgi:excisionase family DNA binding protein
MDPLRDPPFPGKSSAHILKMTTSVSALTVAFILGMRKLPSSPASDGGAHSARVPERFDSSTQGGRPAPPPVPAAALVPIVTSQGMGWLTIDEAATLIRVPKSWLYERTRTNTIPHPKLGKYLRFDRNELLAWTRQFRRDGRGRGRQSFGRRDARQKNQATTLGLKAHRS